MIFNNFKRSIINFIKKNKNNKSIIQNNKSYHSYKKRVINFMKKHKNNWKLTNKIQKI